MKTKGDILLEVRCKFHKATKEENLYWMKKKKKNEFDFLFSSPFFWENNISSLSVMFNVNVRRKGLWVSMTPDLFLWNCPIGEVLSREEIFKRVIYGRKESSVLARELTRIFSHKSKKGLIPWEKLGFDKLVNLSSLYKKFKKRNLVDESVLRPCPYDFYYKKKEEYYVTEEEGNKILQQWQEQLDQSLINND